MEVFNCETDLETEDVNESDEKLEFIVQGGTTDYGHEYEVNMTALFTLKLLLNEDVRDVLVASNAEGYGAFDDVVIRVEYYTKEPELYAIQLKHKLKEGSSIRTNDFNKKTGEFILIKYKESYEAILNKLGDESDALLKDISSKNVTLCLFTNAKLVDYKIFPLESSLLSCRLACTSTQDFIDTNSNEFYKFQINTPRAEIPQYCSEVLRDSFHSEISKSVPEIAGNPGCEEIVNFFQTQLKKQFNEGQVSYETGIKSAFDQTKSRYSKETALVKYIEKYFKQLLKTASDTFSGLQFIKNTDYIQFVQERFETNFDDEEHDIRQSNMTLFERVTKEELKSYASKFSKEIRNPNVSDDRFKDDLFQNVSAQLKTHAQYKFQLKKEREYSSFFRWFQFYDRQVNHKEAVEKIGDLLRISFGEDRPEIVKQIIEFVKAHFEEISPSSTAGYVKIKLLTKDILKLKLLELLTDIKDEKQLSAKYEIFKHTTNIYDYGQRAKILKEINVSLQGRSPVSLYDIAKESFHKTLPTSFLLKNIHETLHVGFKVNNLADIYIKRKFCKIWLRTSVLWKTSKNIFFFKTNLPSHLSSRITVLSESRILTDNSTDRFAHYFANKNFAVIANEDDFSEIVENLRKREYFTSYSFHYLIVNTSEFLEWQRSWFGVESIYNFIIDIDALNRESENTDDIQLQSDSESESYWTNVNKYCEHVTTFGLLESFGNGWDSDLSTESEDDEEDVIITEEKILQYFPKFLNIVSAIPGMGKSTTLKVLVGYCQPNILALTIDLNTYDAALQRKDSELRWNPLDFICNEMMSTDSDEFEKSLLQHLKQERRLILFLDSFDEISPTHSDAVSTIIEEVLKSKIPVWVFTRPNAKSHLEDRFSVLPINMASLTDEDIEYYLTEKLHVSKEKVNDFLIETPVTLYTAPLYLHMLSSIFSELSDLQDLKLMELYGRFVRKSFENYMAKRNIKSTEAVFKSFEVQYLEDHKTAALLAIFGKKYLIENKILDENDLNEVIGYFKDCSNNFELIVSLSDGIPVFFHKTYAEYFSAVKIHEYLSKKKFYILYELLFNQEFEPIRLMFDRITTKGDSLLSAVLEKNEENVEQICNTSPISDLLSKDEFGRSALHFSLSYLQQSDFKSEETATSMRISELILNFLRGENKPIFEQRDKILNLNCYEHAKKCGNESLVQAAAYRGAFKVLELILPDHNCRHLNQQETKSKQSVLHVAILCDKVDSALYLIQMGANVDLKDVEGNTPMHCAAKRGHVVILKALTEKNASVNEINADGWTPLHYASKFGKEKCVTYLLEMGADINAKTDDGESPSFISTATTGQLQKLKLLEMGADINPNPDDWKTEENENLNKIDSSENTAVHLALKNSYNECAVVLIEAGADVNIKDKAGKTPMHIASEQGCMEVFNCLLERHANVNEIDSDGNTPLHLALIKGRTESATCLVKAGSDVNLKNNENKTPLYYVIVEGYTEIMQLLEKEIAASIAAIDAGGNTALHVAIMHNELACANYLIAQGAGINLKNNLGNTPLHCVSQRDDHLKLLEWLAVESANINETNADGNTALHLALRTGSIECAVYLIAAGADINIANFNDEIPLHYAARKGSWAMMGVLEENGADCNAISSDGNTVLHYALLSGDKDTLIYLIEAGADVHVKNKRGCTLMHFAAIKGNTAVLRYLKNKKVKVNEIDFEGNTALHYALLYDHPQCAVYLIRIGADVNIKNKYGRTPVHLVAEYESPNVLNNLNFTESTYRWSKDFEIPLRYEEHVAILKLLIEKNANINEVDSKGNTALHIFLRNEFKKKVIYLLERGADVNIKNNFNETPLHLAVERGYLDVIRMLKEIGANFDETDYKGDTLLHRAARKGYKDGVLYLIKELSANCNARNNDGNTPFHVASAAGHIDIFHLLIQQNININDSNFKGCTALHVAAFKGDTKVVIFLVLAGADVNLKNGKGETPMHLAAFGGQVNILRFLQNQKTAAINETDCFGNTALHCASNKNCAFVLIEAGLDVNVTNKNGETPIHLAAKNGRLDVLKVLNENGGKINELTEDKQYSAFELALQNKNGKCARYLLEAGASINFKDKNGGTLLRYSSNQYQWSEQLLRLLTEKNVNLNEVNLIRGQSVLHSAVLTNHKEFALHLIEAGADVNTKDLSNKTPVHYAAEKGYLDMLYMLKEKGADFDVIDLDGDTVLHCASSAGHVKCVTYLEKVGANLNAKNRNGETPLHLACERGHLDVLKLLDTKGSNIDEVDLMGSTALHKALSNGYVDVALYLEAADADVNLENKKGQTPADLAEQEEHLGLWDLFKRRKNEAVINNMIHFT